MKGNIVKNTETRGLTKTLTKASAASYVRKGDGRSVQLNAAAMRMIGEYILAVGGNRVAAAKLRMHENSIANLKRGRCNPRTWARVYRVVSKKKHEQ